MANFVTVKLTHWNTVITHCKIFPISNFFKNAPLIFLLDFKRCEQASSLKFAG
jgi:hypothetical protein